MAMPAFLWPQRRAPGESLPVRVGRVLHWTGAAGGAAALLLGLAVALFSRSADAVTSGLGLAVLGVGAVLLSRGLRYILAAE